MVQVVSEQSVALAITSPPPDRHPGLDHGSGLPGSNYLSIHLHISPVA